MYNKQTHRVASVNGEYITIEWLDNGVVYASKTFCASLDECESADNWNESDIRAFLSNN